MIGPKFWRKYFKVYDILNLLPVYSQLLSVLRAELDAKQGELILDAGSGTGNLSLGISEAGGWVVALDYCREALESHRSKGDHGGLILADLAKELPFVDNCFDKVVSNNVLYTLSADDQRVTLMELHRVLKAGGKIILANPRTGQNPLSMGLNVIADNVQADGLWTTAKKIVTLMPGLIKMAYYNWKLETENQHHRFSLDEQRALLEDVGFFEVTETKLVYAGQSVLNSAYK